MAEFASFELAGMQKLQDALAQSPARAVVALAGALWREANRIMTDAKAETPVRRGTLRASGGVGFPEVHSNGVEVVMGFGGAARSYAVMQHERTDFRHRVGKAHYLSDPMAAAAPGMQARMAADISAADLFPGV